ncbi:hypothetical protein COCHEDRAFT_1096226 [Bipolaris maydis C5]|uniref:Zn(2)-C6 fungal-type domain-containing protein n=1 Tax=Cochliobolus heterostrophus (strain C5 / ATCC 48332 / race O) TaxID=701091 RepID=M2V114_COCH5|nr:hypothetical protein COCHEDRAFT_1095710 [Bipolaris maydis C5]EMD93657.1 hypothetical protein COCHEDRAFT_1096226 [Bipolaris maydis C5]
MPKVQKPRAPRPQTSTEQKRSRATRVEQEGLEMDFRCKRCEEKKLRCFVETTSGRCAGCISVGAECSLFVSEEEWEKVREEREERELAVARLEAQLSQQKLELLEVKKRERSFARRDLAIIAVQDLAKEQAEGSSAPGGTGLPVVEPSLSGPSADLGGLQADYYDPSFDYSFLFEGLPLASPGASDGIYIPVLNFLDLVLVVFELYFRC